MSFSKADQLIELATLASGFIGVTIDDVVDRFSISKRTAQRMLHTLERRFPNVTAGRDGEGRKRWRLSPGHLRDLLTLTPEELTALDLAVEMLKRSGQSDESELLRNLRDKVVSLVPRSKAARIETDHDALLEAQGLAARPGPKSRSKPEISAVVGEAIKACRILKMRYRSRSEATASNREILPYGVLTGLRRYVVGRTTKDPAGAIRMYRTEDIVSAELTDTFFERDPRFNLREFANRAFGVYQNDKEYGEVVWRFLPAAAAHAREFEFHPQQTMEDQPDGSLIVRFRAAGHLEMCWHLYAWGDKVEVMAPEALRKMCRGHRRGDFPGLP